MNKPFILCVLAALAAFGQSQTPLTITQSAGSATGELRMQERRTNGQDYVGIRAPQSVAANTVWTLPSADGTSGQCLTTDGAGSWRWAACGGTVSMPSYDWSQTPGGSISVGANTITLTPCPASVDGTNSDHYVYLSGGTGTAEYVLITGGTCTSGAATGTIEFTAANTHTGAWTASSASDGLQESLYSVADGAKVAVVVPEGSYNIYATVSAGTRPVTVACTSLGAIFSAKSNSITLLDSRSGTGPQVSNCTFRNDDSLTGVTAIYSNSADGPSSGGAFAGRIENNWFVNFDKAIHSVTTNGWHIVGNHIISSPGYNATAAIHTEALTNGDQGTGLIAGNIMTCSATCTYGLLWNGPGALQLKHNNLNGYTTQVHLQPAFGTASATGSTVTWQSGNKFRTNWAGTTIYLGSTARTIASVDSDTQITTSTAIGTVSTTDYYINQSSQVSIMSNNFDAGTNTQYGVRWTGAVTFQNAQIEGNFFSNWSAVNNHQAITIESGTNLNFLGIRNNHIQSSGGTAVYGIRVKSGYGYAVENNQVAGSTTGVSLETTSLYPKASGNQCILIGTACLASTDATAEIMESQSVTYAELAALSAASGSRVYCSNCSAVCATAGTGAIASRVNGSWVCSDGTSSRWTLSGSNIYRASQVGIGAAPVSTAALSISGGSGANELYIADASATTNVQVIAENGYGVVGTYSNHPLYLGSDSNARWEVASTGMLKPFLTDTYDIGDLTTPKRVRAVYSKIIDTALSGGTGDYVRTRKLEMVDSGGATGAWTAVASATTGTSALTIKDNAGSRWVVASRAIASTPANETSFFANLLPAGRTTGGGDAVDDGTLPSLGNLSNRWAYVFGSIVDTNTITIRTGATNNYYLKSDASGNASWAALPTFGDIANGGNTTGATLTIGTNDAQTLSLETNGTGRWSIPITGHLYAGANNTYDIGAGLAANSPRSIYAATSIVTPKIGRDTSASFTIMTDSADRWVFNSAGMLYPAAHDTYDAGLTGTRIRGVYAKFGEFFKSGSTASSDYLETRKYKFKDATGSPGSWDMQADVTATVSQLFSRDNAGDPFRYSVRQSSGSPVNYEILYASLIPEKRNTGLGHSVTDATFPKLGTSSQPWSEIWGTNGDFAGDLTIDGTTVANVLNYASGTMTGTMKPLFNSTGKIGDTSYYYANGYFTTADIGTIEAATAYKMGGTTVINSSRNVVGVNAFAQSITFSAGSTYNLGSTGAPPLNVYGNYIEPLTELVMGSGVSFRGSLIPATNNTYAIGNTSFRLSTVVTTNFNVSGTVTAPNGNTGLSSIRTVGDGSGGSCTITISGGIITASTCP